MHWVPVGQAGPTKIIPTLVHPRPPAHPGIRGSGVMLGYVHCVSGGVLEDQTGVYPKIGINCLYQSWYKPGSTPCPRTRHIQHVPASRLRPTPWGPAGPATATSAPLLNPAHPLPVPVSCSRMTRQRYTCLIQISLNPTCPEIQSCAGPVDVH